VAPLVEAVSSSVRWMVEMKKLSYEVELPETLPWLCTDRGKLNQILMNLIANAIKFTPAGGHIGLEVSANDGAVTFVVSDTGIGIPSDQLPHVFEEFRQIDGSDERSHGGIGLGLALVRRLADLLGAELTSESKTGEGSRFSVTVPKRG
jgi:signal transduction histidine kinase